MRQAETDHLHYRDARGERFSQADFMAKQSCRRLQAAGDPIQLVFAKLHCGAETGQGKVAAIEAGTPEGVVPLVVNSCQPFGPFTVLPNPGFKTGFDLLQLGLRSHGGDFVQHSFIIYFVVDQRGA